MAAVSAEPERVVSIDGAELLVRPIESRDGEALAEFVAGLSEEARFRRFLHPIKRLGDAELHHLTYLDHDDAEALIALDGDRIVGVARYFRLPERPLAAEVAVTVADAWQHRGVGTLLLRRLVVLAKRHGVELFVATCLAANADMLLLLRELDGGIHRIGGGQGTVEVEVRLPADPEPG